MSFPLVFTLAASLHAASGPVVAPDTTLPANPIVRSSGHAIATPRSAGLSLSALLQAETAVIEEARRGGFPGAALAVGRKGLVVMEQGIGRTGWSETDAAVDPERTVYDIASLTKVVATTTAVMLLVEDGKMELDAPVSQYLPDFTGWAKDRVTIRHLLTHTSGLPAWAELWAPTAEASLARAARVPLQRAPGERVEYSDVGFVVLFAAAERAAREPVFRFLDRRVYGPLKMRYTTYAAGAGCEICASTARSRGEAFQGKVHDPIARRLGGVAGNAGLFSTVHDLARFAAMIANEGELEGIRVLKAETIREFTRRQAGTRALGWDTRAPGGAGAGGVRVSARSFGHTGYTGTSIWIDPDRGTWAVLLANRTYDGEGRNRMQALRRAVNDHVARAADDGTVYRRAEN